MTGEFHDSGYHGDNWREHLLESPEQIKKLLEGTKRIAVLGIKGQARAARGFRSRLRAGRGLRDRPGSRVSRNDGMLGQKVIGMAAIPENVDMVNVFRRPSGHSAAR